MADKAFYKIGEACKRLDIQPYVLRYWETEFPMLKPDTSRSGQRVYSQTDMGVIQRIKELLYDEGFTIAGAKKKLDAERADGRQLTFDAIPKPKPVQAPKPTAVRDPEPDAETSRKASEKAPAKKAPARKGPAEKASDKRAAAATKPAKKGPLPKKAPPESQPAPKKAPGKKAPAKKAPPAKKPPAKKTRATAASAVQAEAAANAEAAAAAGKRVKHLEKGIRSALEEARAILSILEKPPAPRQAAKKKS